MASWRPALCSDVPDSITGIMEHAKAAATIHQTGGGTGMTYEFLRPHGAMVSSTTGVASGPVSFMNIVNQVTDVVKQGGVRRGANMGMMRVTHPDVLRFIHAKNDQHSLTNFNISVNVTDKFLKAVDNNEWFQLEFNGEPWNDSIYDPVRDGDYVVYRRPDGSTVTFCDRQAFLDGRSFRLHDRRAAAAGNGLTRRTSGTGSSPVRTSMPSRASLSSTK